MQRNYISPKGLESLKDYKYHASDKSLIANYILQPFWRAAVEWLPRSLAPNLITLLGLAGIILSYLSVALFCPRFVGAAPAYSYLFCAIGMFYYQTMDALDGKQARRTGTSSPLGELFDHGCDALTTVLMGLNLACAVQMNPDLATLLVLFGGFGVFFMAQWEEYHTGIMELGHLSVTEIHYLAISMYLLSYFKGPEWWNSPLYGDFQYNAVPMLVIGLGSAATMIKNTVTVLTTKKHPLSTKILQIVSITHLLLGGIAWAVTSPNQIFSAVPHLFIIAFGFVFAYLAGRIVVARVCREHFSAFHKNSLLLTLPGIVSLLHHQNLLKIDAFVAFEFEILYVCLAIAVVSYFHFALNVIRQMCDHLDIACLTIKPKKQ